MEQKIGCCGFKCYSCAAYEENIESEEARKTVCEKWGSYFEYDIEPKKMHCGGCTAGKGQEHPMIHGDCQYRKCAAEKGLADCTRCGDYPCADLAEYFADYRQAYEELKEEILPEDLEGYFLTYMPLTEQ